MRKFISVDNIDTLLTFSFLINSEHSLIKMDVHNNNYHTRSIDNVKLLVENHIRMISANVPDTPTLIRNYINARKITEKDLPELDSRDTRQCLFVYNALLTCEVVLFNYPETDFRKEIDKIVTLNLYQFIDIKNYNHPYQKIINIANLASSIPKYAMISLIRFLNDKFKNDIKFESFHWVKPTMDKEWISDYIIKSLNKHEIEQYINHLEKLPSLDRAIFLFDNSSQSKDTKKLIIINLKKAWQQKQFRSKLKAKKKKSYSIVMDTGIEKKLNFILESWESQKNFNKEFYERVKVNKNEIIEELINIEYKKITNEKKYFKEFLKKEPNSYYEEKTNTLKLEK